MGKFKSLFLILLATLMVPAELAGQAARVQRVFPSWHATLPTGGPTAMDMSGGQSSLPYRNTSAATNDYRWEGLIIGAVAVGILGAAFGAGSADMAMGTTTMAVASRKRWGAVSWGPWLAGSPVG